MPTVKELNHTYTFEPEDVSLTHVNPGQCRVACAIKDKDTWSKVRAAHSHADRCFVDMLTSFEGSIVAQRHVVQRLTSDSHL